MVLLFEQTTISRLICGGSWFIRFFRSLFIALIFFSCFAILLYSLRFRLRFIVVLRSYIAFKKPNKSILFISTLFSKYPFLYKNHSLLSLSLTHTPSVSLALSLYVYYLQFQIELNVCFMLSILLIYIRRFVQWKFILGYTWKSKTTKRQTWDILLHIQNHPHTHSFNEMDI